MFFTRNLEQEFQTINKTQNGKKRQNRPLNQPLQNLSIGLQAIKDL